MLENFRKTLAYKICGYLTLSMIFLFIATFVFIYATTNHASMFYGLEFFMMGIMIFVILPYIALPILIFLSIIGILTKNKYENGKTNLIADIGYIIMCILFFVSMFSLFIQAVDNMSMIKNILNL